ncbi:MAG: polymer-forming cytoskeletal protein [Candidatus Schekmanbacteria bacterium]|nr:polymer-forming cytoskeletal protein [Candidatus Schekmanbacteria bacterium]
MSDLVRDLSTIRAQPGTGARGQSIIQKGLMITGEIKGEGDVRIEGEMDGDIVIQGSCTVAESGVVKGNVSGESVQVAGSLTGNTTATKSVEILGTGRISGDITVPNIAIADGASVNGRVTVGTFRS